MQHGNNVTWEQLVALEPRLADLKAEARATKPEKGFCADTAFSDSTPDRPSFRRRLERLVGWFAKHPNPVLHTGEAWWVVMQAILAALPPCSGHCGCRG